MVLNFNDLVLLFRYPYVENPSNEPERTNEAAGNYAKACVAVGGEYGTPVVDLWTNMQQFSDWKKAYLRSLWSFFFLLFFEGLHHSVFGFARHLNTNKSHY